MPKNFGARRNYLMKKRMQTDQSIPNYHAKAQAIIKTRKAQGLKTTAKDLPGYMPMPKPNLAERIFHKATQFGDHLKDIVPASRTTYRRKPTAPAVQVKKPASTFNAKEADRKLKGFKFGVGVGP